MDCLYEEVTNGDPLADTHANYVSETECQQLGTYFGDASNINQANGCIRWGGSGAIAGQYSYNTPGDGTTYACGLNGHNCIQKSGNTWINSYTNNVEVQLATYDISKLNDLQNLNRTVANLTVDTLHGLGPELYANPLAKAGSATGTQTIVSCDFPGQVVDVACSDPTKTTEATCVGTCSDTSQTTEAGCLYEEVNSGAPNAELALTEAECAALAGGSLASTNSWTTYPSGCHKVGAATYIFNTNGDSTVNCGETVDSYVRTCVQKTGDTWTPRTWSPATYVCTSPTTWTPIAGESSIALKGANPDTIVQNSSYTDSGGVCYDGNGTKVVSHCSDSSKMTEAACLANVVVTSGAPDLSITKAECELLDDYYNERQWQNEPQGCIISFDNDGTTYVNYNSYDNDLDCAGNSFSSSNCLQKSGNTWTQQEITVSGQVDTTAACGTEVTLTYDCPGAAQVSRKVVVECP